MRKVWNKVIGMICAGGLSAMCLAGCGKDAPSIPETLTQEIQQGNETNKAQTGKENGGPQESGGSRENGGPLGTEGSQENGGSQESGGSQENGQSQESGGENKVTDEGGSGRSGDGAFYDGANLQGSVVEFSETGFSLSPATTRTDERGGEIMEEAAPGSEVEENNIWIAYTDNTVFQIINFNMNTQSEVSREDTDRESVKKRSSVCVYGSCQDTHNWTADKILIFRWQ